MSFTAVGVEACCHCSKSLPCFSNRATIDFYRSKGITYATQLSRVETRCPSFRCTPAGPQSSLIDFPLHCHCGGLFKHTFCDVQPRRARNPQAIMSKRERNITERAAPPRGDQQQLQHHHNHSELMFTWASLVPATHHGSHAESHPLVLVHHVGQEFGRRCHRDALLVAKLIDATLSGQQALPEATVGSSSSHGTQQIGVDLNHLLHRLGGDVGACCGPGVHGHDDAMLELWQQEHQLVLHIQTSAHHDIKSPQPYACQLETF